MAVSFVCNRQPLTNPSIPIYFRPDAPGRDNYPSSISHNDQTFASRLQQLWIDHGSYLDRCLSQRSFGMLLGINSERYGSYERANREPTLETLATLRRITGVSLDDLIASAKDE